MPKIKNNKKAKLILEDGSVFTGFFFGSHKTTSGEVVFNTGMTGYPETLTDPSYSGEILIFTFPLIGNYGAPTNIIKNHLSQNLESEKIHIRGLIVADYSFNHSHWDATKSLDEFLKEHAIPGIYGIDTRALTKKIRESGVMAGKIIAVEDIPFENFDKTNFAGLVSTQEKITYKAGNKKIILVDCGVKHNIIREFLKRDVTVIRVPWDYDFTREEYDGLFLSNGPGNPKTCETTIKHIKKAIKQNKPTFGICLGNQLLALAAGADTYKLKYGHRSQNQPCIEVGTNRCFITSQNHGFAVNEKTLPQTWKVWFQNANDGTNEGIRHKTKPFFSVQFHPEASPGPTDTHILFDEFVNLL